MYIHFCCEKAGMKCKLTATFTTFIVFLFGNLRVFVYGERTIRALFVLVHFRFCIWCMYTKNVLYGRIWDVRQKQFLAVYSNIPLKFMLLAAIL